MINIGIGVGWAKAIYSVANNVIANFKARVLSYPNSIFEAEPCLDATLVGLNAIGLLKEASLVITPNAYNEGILYDVVPNTTLGDMNVVRATTATRVNSLGLIENVGLNVPRLNYDVAGSCPSILIEPQRTNLITYSNDFSNAVWNKEITGTGVEATVVSSNVLAPDGNNSFLVTLNSGIGTTPSDKAAVVRSIFGIVNGLAYTETIYLKGVTGGEQVILGLANIGTIKVTLTTSWQRFVLSGISGGTYNDVGVSIRRGILEPINSYAQFYMYGAQLEQGSYPTSYIPTVASTVTRNADVISKTGISSLIGQTEGTIYYEFSVPLVENITRVLSVSGSDTNNRINISTFAGSIFVRVDVAGANQVNANVAISVTNMNKIAFRYKANDFSLYVNGVNVITDTSGITFPAATLDRISNVQPDGTFPFNGNIKEIVLFKTALTNSELAQLTTL